MIVLNQCRIDPEGKHLIIEATVENLSYYKDVYIDSIIIDTNENYSPNGPVNKPVYPWGFAFTPENEQVYIKDTCNNYKEVIVNDGCECDVYTSQKVGVKHIKHILSAKDLNLTSLDNNIFFVYVIAGGTPAPCIPCGMDNKYTMGIAVNMRPIYNIAMKYIKELESNCSIPKGFIDMILRIKAFELSLKTGNFPTAFKQWDKLFKNKISISPNSGCGCNGIN